MSLTFEVYGNYKDEDFKATVQYIPGRPATRLDHEEYDDIEILDIEFENKNFKYDEEEFIKDQYYNLLEQAAILAAKDFY